MKGLRNTKKVKPVKFEGEKEKKKKKKVLRETNSENIWD